MHPTDIDQQKLLISSPPAPFSFGYHPNFERSYNEFWQRPSGNRLEDIEKIEVPLSRFVDSRHPEVFVIPRDRFIIILEMEGGEPVGPGRMILPFSSTDFCVDLEEEGLFYEFNRSEAFFRLMGISQLGYLVPPRPEEWDKSQLISYLRPTFHHSRWEHSLLAAVIMEVILARNGFPPEERNSVVLTAGSHDIAIPAGGDSVKRVDPKNLDEEKNFSWVLEHYGLTKRWAKQFGFNIALAQDWVRGKWMSGKLLDVVDKICYTALDCYHVGFQRPSQIRNFCLKHPLVMDVWQDIRFIPDHTNFAFSQPENLYWFLLLRAYEFQEFLYNPYSRALDLFLKKLTQPLYRAGIITKEKLLTCNDSWLEQILSQYYPEEIKWIIEPEEISWEKFETEKGQREFCAKLGNRVDHAEHLVGPSTGLDWLVSDQGKIVPLRRVISQEKIKILEDVCASTRGYYVYYKRS